MMSPRGGGFEGGRPKWSNKRLIIITIELAILAAILIVAFSEFFFEDDVVLQNQEQEEHLVKLLKGGGAEWCVIVDYFLLPYIRITDSHGERWFRVAAVDDSALYVSKYASLAVLTGDKKRIWVKTSQNPVDLEGYDTLEEFLERFSGKCGEKMKNFCKKHKLPYARIRKVCCDD